jgi:hypothetical protein
MEETMKATTGRIWEAASKDPRRPVLMHVYFDAKAATLAATDSFILARVPCVVEDGDESGLIPADALKTAAGASLRIADGKATLALADGGERSWPLMATGAFPDVDGILNDHPAGDVSYGLNTTLLHNLSQALTGKGIGQTQVVLSPYHPERGIATRAFGNGTEAVGVITPLRLPGEQRHAANGKPNMADDDALIAAVKAAQSMLDRRRGKKAAARKFRDVLAREAAS